MNEQLEFVKQIAERLDAADIRYIIECHLEDSPKIAQLFKADCYVDEDSIRNAVIRRSMFNIIHNEWMVKADFIVRGSRSRIQLSSKGMFKC